MNDPPNTKTQVNATNVPGIGGLPDAWQPLLKQLIDYRLFDDGLLSNLTLDADWQGDDPTDEVAEDNHTGNSAKQLLKQLVDRKYLTAYQVRQIQRGKIDSLVLGNYVILDKLGQGGMGLVLKATHRRMKRQVAIKILSPDVTRSPEAIARFQREVEAAAKLDHPNIVTAYDADEADGTHFFVMQLVDGSDLGVVVRKHGPLSIDQSIHYVIQAARGLQYAHQRGIVHRDIKPSNLLVDANGHVKILDMGLARVDSAISDQDPLTATGQIMGTIDYMAPEQAQNTHNADARADIYSLGITFWFLLTGRRVFESDTMVNTLLAHQTDPIPSLRKRRPDISVQQDAIFARMAAKDPNDRFQNMAEVIEALEQCSVDIGKGNPIDPKLNAFLSNMSVPHTAAANVVPPTNGDKTTSPKESFHQASTDPILDPTVVLPRAASDTGISDGQIVGNSEDETNTQHGSRLPPISRGLLIAAGAAAFFLFAGVIIVKVKSRDGKTTTVKAPVGSDIEVMNDGRVEIALPGASAETSKESHAPSSGQSAPDFALFFDGKDDYVEAPRFIFDPSKPCTIEALVRASEPSGDSSPVIDFSQRIMLDRRCAPLDRWQISGLGEGGAYLQNSLPPVNPTEPAHLACVVGGGQMRLFVDGVPQRSRMLFYKVETRKSAPVEDDIEIAIVEKVSDFGLRIGNLFKSGYFFHGKIDEVRVSDCIRYPSQFEPASRFEPDENTLALYHFDEGSGDTLMDASGNENHGTIHGARWINADGSEMQPSSAAAESQE